MFDCAQRRRIVDVFQRHIHAAGARLSVTCLRNVIKACAFACIVRFRLKMHVVVVVDPATAVPEISQAGEREFASAKSTERVVGQQIRRADDGLDVFNAVNAVAVGFHSSLVVDARDQ